MTDEEIDVAQTFVASGVSQRVVATPRRSHERQWRRRDRRALAKFGEPAHKVSAPQRLAAVSSVSGLAQRPHRRPPTHARPPPIAPRRAMPTQCPIVLHTTPTGELLPAFGDGLAAREARFMARYRHRTEPRESGCVCRRARRQPTARQKAKCWFPSKKKTNKEMHALVGNTSAPASRRGQALGNDAAAPSVPTPPSREAHLASDARVPADQVLGAPVEELTGADEQVATAAPLVPPYTGEEDIAQGLKCFLCTGKAYVGTSWYNLMQHVARHKDPAALLDGSPLKEKAMMDKHSKQHQRRATKKLKHSAEERDAGTAQEQVPGAEDMEGAPVDAPHAVATSAPAGPLGMSPTYWKQMMVYIKCDRDSNTLPPFEIRFRRRDLPPGASVIGHVEVQSESPNPPAALSLAPPPVVAALPPSLACSGPASPCTPNAGSDPFSSSHKILASLDARAAVELEKGDIGAFEQVFLFAERLRGQLIQLGGSAPEPSASVSPTPPPQAEPQPQDVLLREIKKLQVGGDEVPVPQVRVAPHALAWDGGKKSRTKWPFKHTITVTVVGFQQYMVPIRVSEDTFRDNQAMGMSYLFHLLDIDQENYSDIGVIQALNDQGILADLAKLRIMDPTFSWTMKIFQALKHCVSFMLMECEQKGLGPARKSLTLLKDKIITDTLKACNEHRKEAKQTRKELDGERLRNCMTLEEAKRTLLESMIDLQAVRRIVEHEGATALTPFWQRVATVNMAWQLTLPGTFARSGELEGLYEHEVLDSRADGKTYVVISKHKTVKKRGKLGRHFTDAMWAAVECYSALPPLEGSAWTKESRPFLRPAKPHMKRAGLYSLLRTGGRIFCPERTFPRTNLQRKLITSAVRKDENVEKCKQWVAEFNAHLPSTGEENYLIEPPEEQALKGKTMTNAFFGSPVAWPMGDDLPPEAVDEAKSRLLGKYGRYMEDGDDDDEDSEAEEESDGDEDCDADRAKHVLDQSMEGSSLVAAAKSGVAAPAADRPDFERGGEGSGKREAAASGDSSPKKPRRLGAKGNGGRVEGAPSDESNHSAEQSSFGPYADLAPCTPTEGRHEGHVISDADQKTLWKHDVAQRKTIFSDAEKTFIVGEVRAAQEVPNEVPRKAVLDEIISKGIEGGYLAKGIQNEDEFATSVRAFVRTFLKMSQSEGTADA